MNSVLLSMHFLDPGNRWKLPWKRTQFSPGSQPRLLTLLLKATTHFVNAICWMSWVTRDRYFPLSQVITTDTVLSNNTALTASLTWMLPLPHYIIYLFCFGAFGLNFSHWSKKEDMRVGGNRWGWRVVLNCYVSKLMLERLVSMAGWGGKVQRRREHW